MSHVITICEIDVKQPACRRALAALLRYCRRERKIWFEREIHGEQFTAPDNRRYEFCLSENGRSQLIQFLRDHNINVIDAVNCSFCGKTVIESWAETDEEANVACLECLGERVIRCDYSDSLIERDDAVIVVDEINDITYFVAQYIDAEQLALWLNIDERQISFTRLPSGGFGYLISNAEHDIYIYSYHCGPRDFKRPTKFDPRWPPVGIELEIELPDPRKFVKAVREKFNEKTVIFERDSSLDDNFGVECIFAPFDLIQASAVFREFLEIVNRHSGEGDECDEYGLHINVQPNLSDFELAKLLTFVHDPENITLLQKLAGRAAGYGFNFGCDAKTNARRKISKALSKYRPIHIKPSRLLEFRLFQSTVKFDILMRRIETVYALLHFVQQIAVRDLNADTFIAFVRSHRKAYPRLAEFV